MGNGEYELCHDDQGDIFFWRRCTVPGCEAFVCLGASEEYCYLHTLEHLIKQQIAAINVLGNHAPDQAHVCISGKYPWGNKQKLEAMLMCFADHEINLVGQEWLQSALEIIKRIKT